MRIQIKQLALESEAVDYHFQIDSLMQSIAQNESALDPIGPEEIPTGMENLAGDLATGLTMSVFWQALGPKGYLTIKRIAEDYADIAKSWTAWIDVNQISRNALRTQINSLKRQLKDSEAVHGASLITYLGDKAHHARDVGSLIHLLSNDLSDTDKYLTSPAITTAKHARVLTEFICDKDNDFTIGWDNAVIGCRSLIERSISDHVKFGVKAEVEGQTFKQLGMPVGTEFSPLLLGNVVSATNWSERHEEAKHNLSTVAALGEYEYGIHDLVHVPKSGNKYAISGKCSKKEFMDILDIAEQYLDQAEEINEGMVKHGHKNIKTILMSNWFNTLAANGVKTRDNGPWITPVAYRLGKFAFSRNYRKIYTLMRCCVNWSMKLQRKAVTRNIDMAKHLVDFVKVNSK